MSNIYGLAKRMASKNLRKYGAAWQFGKVAYAGTEERPVKSDPVYKTVYGIYEEKRRMGADGLRVEIKATVVVQPGSNAEIGDPVLSPLGKKYTVDDITPVHPSGEEIMSRIWLA